MNLDVSIPMDHLFETFKNPFPKIKVKYTSKIDKKKITETLLPSHSHSYDKISTKIIKDSVHLISSPLTYICNQYLSTGFFHHA